MFFPLSTKPLLIKFRRCGNEDETPALLFPHIDLKAKLELDFGNDPNANKGTLPMDVEGTWEFRDAALNLFTKVQGEWKPLASDAVSLSDLDVAMSVQTPTLSQNKLETIMKLRWRDDGRCGPNFKLESGADAQCNADSEAHCCSPAGWCGGSAEFCNCEGP